jgi:hypothetical protein
MLVSAGSAATTTKPYTANLCDSGQLVLSACPEGTTTPPALPGGTAVVYLTLHNTANPQSLGSANIGLPAVLPAGSPQISYASASLPPGAGTVSSTPSLVMLRNLNLASGRSLTVTLTLNTPTCISATYDWGAAGVLRVKQSNDFNGPPGNDFTRAQPSSLTATVSGDCHLAVVPNHQPQDTIKSQTITDALFSSGGAVQVGLYDSADNLIQIDGSCPSGPGCVTAGFTGGDPSATLSGTKQQPLVDGKAYFGDLKLNKTNVDSLYALTFSSPGVTGTTSEGFSITDSGQLCNPGTCSLSSTFTGTGSTPTTSSTVSTTFSTTGGLSFTFFTSGLPTAVVGPGGGCQNFVPTSSPGVTLGIHGSTGTAFIDYGISDKALKQRYGPSYGQPNVPICVGAQRLDSTGHKVACDKPDLDGPWTGKALDSTGKPNGQFSVAVCDPTTHLWWSVAPTFQDNPSPPGFAPLSILISAWGGSTAPDGTNLRTFTITKPNPWDYSMRG